MAKNNTPEYVNENRSKKATPGAMFFTRHLWFPLFVGYVRGGLR